MTIIAEGWPRTVRDGPVRSLLYKLDAEAGDWLNIPSPATVYCSHDVEVQSGRIVFKERAIGCYCDIEEG